MCYDAYHWFHTKDDLISDFFSASFQNLIVKVVNDGGNKYQIDGVTAPKLTLQKGHTYRVDMSDNSNSNHPLLFRNRAGNTSYSDGVHQNGTAGQNGAYTQIHVKQDAPNQLRYYCTVHGNGMGNSITVQSAFNTVLEDNLVVRYQLTKKEKLSYLAVVFVY